MREVADFRYKTVTNAQKTAVKRRKCANSPKRAIGIDCPHFGPNTTGHAAIGAEQRGAVSCASPADRQRARSFTLLLVQIVQVTGGIRPYAPRSKGLGNASFLYQIARTNGDPVKGSYRREELQIVPVMRDKWNPGPSKGRGFIDKLRVDGIVSK